jgi:hypothetical protein
MGEDNATLACSVCMSPHRRLESVVTTTYLGHNLDVVLSAFLLPAPVALRSGTLLLNVIGSLQVSS